MATSSICMEVGSDDKRLINSTVTNIHCLFISINFRREVRNIVRAGAILHGEPGAVAREEDGRCDRAEATAELCRWADNRTVSAYFFFDGSASERKQQKGIVMCIIFVWSCDGQNINFPGSFRARDDRLRLIQSNRILTRLVSNILITQWEIFLTRENKSAFSRRITKCLTLSCEHLIWLHNVSISTTMARRRKMEISKTKRQNILFKLKHI